MFVRLVARLVERNGIAAAHETTIDDRQFPVTSVVYLPESGDDSAEPNCPRRDGLTTEVDVVFVLLFVVGVRGVFRVDIVDLVALSMSGKVLRFEGAGQQQEDEQYECVWFHKDER